MSTLKVLIVDDEKGMREGMSRALQNYTMKLQDIDEEITFRTEFAENGDEAIIKYRAYNPDILLLDYKLPDITGLEILEKLETNEETTLTIMVTAYASLETAVSAIRAGAFDFLAKPFTPQELRNTVSKAAQSLILARQVKKLSEERKQVRFQFISVLGHELKSPLSAIDGYLNMMKESILGSNLESYKDIIARCLVRTDQMKKLIVDLLEMTKIESGNRDREIISVNLTEIANMSVENVLPDATKRNINIQIHTKEPVIILADPIEMEIILNNLVSNAVKYNRENGKVDIILDKDQQYIRIIVKDTGIGMTEEETKKLFKEFVRIKNSKTKDILGSGLGLSTIKKIAQLYNGDVNVVSEPDVGSTFTVLLKSENINTSN